MFSSEINSSNLFKVDSIKLRPVDITILILCFYPLLSLIIFFSSRMVQRILNKEAERQGKTDSPFAKKLSFIKKTLCFFFLNYKLLFFVLCICYAKVDELV